MDSRSRGNDGKKERRWIPACAGMTKKKRFVRVSEQGSEASPGAARHLSW
jgi:hypothetical protein